MNKSKSRFIVLIALLCALLLSSCSTVSRVEVGSKGDLTGDWNEIDVALVCDDVINELLKSPAMNTWSNSHKGKVPVIRVATYRNESHDHLDTSIVTDKMQESIMNSGRAYFAANREDLGDINAELEYGLDNAAFGTAKSIGNQAAVDFVLQGSVKTIVQKNGNKEVKTYYVKTQLTDVESGIIVWQNTNDTISKYIKSNSVRW